MRRFIWSTILCVLAIPAGAAIVKEFDASGGSPGDAGWFSRGGVLSGMTTTALGETVWQMTGDNCCGYWYSGLTPAQWNDAFTLGWSLSGRARVSEGTSPGYVFLDTPAGMARRWDMPFGVSGGKGWVGLSMFTDFANPALKHTLPDNDLFDFEMKYDPASKSASLRVDGLTVLDGYQGHVFYRESHGPAFGVAGFTTKAQFESVRFSIAYPVVADPGTDPSAVPEPSAWALAATGLFLAAGRLAMRRSVV